MDVLGRVGIEDLIEICSAADQRAFDALWRTRGTAARAAAVARGEVALRAGGRPPTGPTTSTSPRPALRLGPGYRSPWPYRDRAWCRTRRPIP